MTLLVFSWLLFYVYLSPNLLLYKLTNLVFLLDLLEIVSSSWITCYQNVRMVYNCSLKFFKTTFSIRSFVTSVITPFLFLFLPDEYTCNAKWDICFLSKNDSGQKKFLLYSWILIPELTIYFFILACNYIVL